MKKDPFEQNVESQCAACGKPVMVSKGGNGRCSHCNWYNNEIGLDNEDRVIYPNYIPLNKAKKLAKEGKPFEISIDDLIGGALFYCEMFFEYNGKTYELCGKNDDSIELIWKGGSQLFANKNEFKEKAKVENQLLKDVWDKVENISYA